MEKQATISSGNFNIDIKLLKAQKLQLLYVLEADISDLQKESLIGILHLIDAIQDENELIIVPDPFEPKVNATLEYIEKIMDEEGLELSWNEVEDIKNILNGEEEVK